ncbi:MAG: hypothetical protein H0T39_09740, partial [Actinobacteria bacterium]|nr:hypothetical protein [Actinomycetota bacterium]
ADEWLETTIDHPIEQLTREIIFPKERPCRRAALVVGGRVRPLESIRRQDGRSAVRIHIPHPQPDTPYTICWAW